MGMLSNLVESVGKSLGLGGGQSSSDLERANLAAEARERKRLEEEERVRKSEARFMRTEGLGKRRFGTLQFGDSTDRLDPEQKSVQATGRFGSDRLVL